MANTKGNKATSELSQWLKDNGCTKAIQSFLKHDISLKQLVQSMEDEGYFDRYFKHLNGQTATNPYKNLEKYLKDFELPTHLHMRIWLGMQATTQSRIENQKLQKEIPHIIMSDQESKTIHDLMEYDDLINTILQSLSIQKTTFIENERSMKSRIDKIRKIFKQRQEITRNILLSCYIMLKDHTMPQSVREQKMISLAKEVINEQLSLHTAHYLQSRFEQQQITKV